MMKYRIAPSLVSVRAAAGPALLELLPPVRGRGTAIAIVRGSGGSTRKARGASKAPSPRAPLHDALHPSPQDIHAAENEDACQENGDLPGNGGSHDRRPGAVNLIATRIVPLVLAI